MNINQPFFPWSTTPPLSATNNAKWVQIVSSAVTGTTAETSLLGAGMGSLTLAPEDMTVGTVIRFSGNLVLDITNTKTVTLKPYFGTGNLLASTGTITGTLTFPADGPIEGLFTIQTVGATGTIYGGGRVMYFSDAFNYAQLTMNTPLTIDTTQAITFGLTAQLNNTGDTVTLQNFVYEVLKPSQP